MSPPPDKNDPTKAVLQPSKKHRKRAKKANLPVDGVRTTSLDKSTLPADAVNKGTDTVVIQELIIRRNNIRFELEQFYSPSEGKTHRAQLPLAYQGSLFGPTLRAYVNHQYHKNRVTEPLLLKSLEDHGVDISAGELSDMLTHKNLCFAAEADEMYKAGELFKNLKALYLPLHNNPAEQEQRPRVIKKKISYGTRSSTGLKTLDTMQSLMRTCGKLGLSFWHFLIDRLSRANQIPSLADLIYEKADVIPTKSAEI